MGSAPHWRQMVQQSALAALLSLFPTDASTAFAGYHDVERLDSGERALRRRLRYRHRLSLRLERPLVSRLFLFLFDRATSRRRALGAGALHALSRTGDVQLVRPDQPNRTQRGLP